MRFLLFTLLFLSAIIRLSAQTCTPDSIVVACDDGNTCTINDSCRNGVCSGIPSPAVLPCDDGNACTVNDSCRNGVCSGTFVTCPDTDGNPCTSAACNPLTGCYIINNTNSCDDGNPCTINDRCVNGICAGTPKNCNDGNPCTTDYCDPVTGNCMFVYNTASCNDGNPCTVNDHCLNGVCVGGNVQVCNDNNPCTIDACGPSGGCIFFVSSGSPCDDNNNCTVNDMCVNGNCTGTVSSGVVRSVTTRLDDNSAGSFRAIVAAACENDIISFAVDTVFLSAPVLITRNLTISGNGAGNTVINGNNATRLLTIPAPVSLGLSNISLINGYASADGGAFFNEGTMFVKDITLKHNYEGVLPKAFSGTGSITVLTAGSLQILQ